MSKNLLGAVALLMLVSCDSGDILEQERVALSSGCTVKLTAMVSGQNDWGDDYRVVLAGFSEGNKYAVVQRALPSLSTEGSSVELILSNLQSDVNTIELAVTDRLRQRVITFVSFPYTANTDTLRMNLGHIRVDRQGALQQGLFNVACVQCHGQNGRQAAGLDLTEGNSFMQLIGQASTRIEGEVRVQVGSPETSLLWRILNEGGENILRYNHTEVLSSQFKENIAEVRKVLRSWIESLEKND